VLYTKVCTLMIYGSDCVLDRRRSVEGHRNNRDEGLHVLPYASVMALRASRGLGHLARTLAQPGLKPPRHKTQAGTRIEAHRPTGRCANDFSGDQLEPRIKKIRDY
jgi:hypothetical protein